MFLIDLLPLLFLPISLKGMFNKGLIVCLVVLLLSFYFIFVSMRFS
jgi:hypothetical protein